MSHSINENFGQDEFLDYNTGSSREKQTKVDDRITEEACEILMKEKFIDKIEVNVKEGVVYLFGTVDTRSEKISAEIAIRGIAGIKDIHNELKVKDSDNSSGI